MAHTKMITKRVLIGGLLILLMALWVVGRPAHALPGSVVINEILYNPQSAVDGDEFLELHNTTASPIDISGWCFTSGINLCFSTGTTLAAYSFEVVSNNAPQTLATYGAATIGTYTGKLDNGGETLTLSDASSQVVDTFTYDDASPWPSAPDGSGPSLERKDPSNDAALPESWASSTVSGGTPGVVNSVYALQVPTLQDLSVPVSPSESETPLITVRAESADSVELHYTVMFNTQQTVTMVDDGSGGDQTSGDGIYSAQVPAQAAGSLVRVLVEATNADGSSSLPAADDSMPRRSYIVDDGQSSELPIIRWYIEPTIYDDLITNHTQDDFYVPTIIAVGDQIFDGAEVKVKGQSSASYPKKKFSFTLPKGYTLGAPYFQYPVDEFAINVYFLNMTDLQEKLAWNGFSSHGFDNLQSQYARVQRNDDGHTSKFMGHYLMIEGYDKSWRERTGHQEGALYKQFDDKKTRKDEDHSDIFALQQSLENLTGEQLKDYISDNLDVPALINYDALSTILMHQDWHFYKNMYQYRDTDGTGRWSLLPWDLDNALAMPVFKPENTPMYFNIDPLHSTNDPSYTNLRLTQNAMYQFPEFKEMYYRRVSTLYDQIHKSGQLLSWYGGLFDKSKDTINEDLVEWQDEKAALLNMAFPSGIPWDFPDDFPYSITPEQAMSGESTADVQDGLIRYGYGKFLSMVEAERSSGNLPQSQSGDAKIVITEINYSPLGGVDDQYIELHNPGSTAVDISRWQLSGGVQMTLPEGAVIPSGGYMLVVKNDVSFRSAYPGTQYVLGEYEGELGSSGENELTLTRPDNSVATSFSYKTSSSWPTLGLGDSLSLIRTDGDPGNAYCWAPSQDINGTPGAPNTLDQNWVASYSSRCQPLRGQDGELAGTGMSLRQALLIAGFIILTSFIAIKSLINTSKSVMLKLYTRWK